MATVSLALARVQYHALPAGETLETLAAGCRQSNVELRNLGAAALSGVAGGGRRHAEDLRVGQAGRDRLGASTAAPGAV
jgi:hypothetical protein